MYRLCIFDLDGTLINSLGDLADSVNEALRAEGLPEHEEAAYRYFVGNGARKLIERALPAELREDKALFDRVYRTYDEAYHRLCLNKTRPYDGIPGLLDKLRAAGIRTAVLSNKPDPFTQHIAGHFFGAQMDLILGQREGIAKKPAPDGVFEILRRLDVLPEESLFIGDTNVDVETARNAGLRCLGVCWGFRGREELEEAGADFLAEHAGEALQQILQGE